MRYIPDDSSVTIDQVKKRLLETDLIPSMEPLKANLDALFLKLEAGDIANLKDLRSALGTKGKLRRLSVDMGIDERLLALLNR